MRGHGECFIYILCKKKPNTNFKIYLFINIKQQIWDFIPNIPRDLQSQLHFIRHT